MVARYFDTRLFPLIIATPPSADLNGAVRAFYQEWDPILARGRQAVLVDLSAVNPLFTGATLRREVAIEIQQRRAALSRALIAEARVVHNAVVRGLLTALDWLIGDSLSHPIRYFDDAEEAKAWLRSAILNAEVSPRSLA
jgi:hypothetical protein